MLDIAENWQGDRSLRRLNRPAMVITVDGNSFRGNRHGVTVEGSTDVVNSCPQDLDYSC